MAKKTSVKTNYLLSTFYQILTILTPLLTAPYISRVFGADLIGIYSYTSSLVSFFGIFAILGTATYGQRVIARCRDDRAKLSQSFWEIELLSIISSTITIVAWIIFVLTRNNYKFYLTVLTIQLFSVAFDISWFYAGLEKFVFTVSRNVVVRIVSIICLFIFVRDKSDLPIYFFLMTVPGVVGNLSMWIPLRRFINKPVWQQIKLKAHLKETLVYFVPAIAATAYTYIDKVMIGAITHVESENGFYEQTTRIIKMAYVLVSSLNTVMTTRMSYLFQKENEAEIRHKLNQSLSFIMFLSIPLTLGICGIAYNFVPWFFGDGFEKVRLLLILYSPLILIQGFHSFLIAQYLIPSGQRARSNIGVIIGSCVNLIFNAIFIPRLQSVGAVLGTLIAESTIAIIYLRMSKEYVSIKMVLKYMYKPLICGLIMLFVVIAIGWGHSGSIIVTILQICGGAATYFALMYLFKDQNVINCIAYAHRIILRIKKKMKG